MVSIKAYSCLCGKEILFSLFLFLLLWPGEVSIIKLLGDRDSGEIHSRACGDDICLVNTAERDTIDLEGAFVFEGLVSKPVSNSLMEDVLPVIKSRPEGSCFKKTTRLPLNLPASRIRTVPGVIEGLKRVGR